MSNNQEPYKVTFSSPEIHSVLEYVSDPNSIARLYQKDPDRFLAILGEDGQTNRQRIEAGFKWPEDKVFIGANAASLPIKIGTLLYLEYSKLNAASVSIDGIGVISTDEPAFKAAALAAIEGDLGYSQLSKPVNGKLLTGTSQEILPDVTVWIWCRSLSNVNSELNGQFFDLTPFVQRITTNIGKNGGNWQITLPPLVCVLDANSKWVIKPGTVDQYQNESRSSIQGMGYVAHSTLFQVETYQDNPNKDAGDVLAKSQFLFHNMIRPNDLIFIRYETLDMEKEQRYSDNINLYVNKNNIANRIYDMIGLVDTNTETINPATTDVTITVSGRDLSKLFIEDGTYFYALENSQGLLKFAGQSEKQNSQINRIFGDGALDFINLYLGSSIELILKFIIQQLANIKIVPNNLFASYGDRVNKKENVTTISTSNTRSPTSTIVKSIKEEPANGIWQIVKLVIDSSVSGRRLCDSSFSTANGSLLNFLRMAIQEPLMELYMDTYGDMYHLIVRQPPYTQKALISLIEGKINTEDGSIITPPAIMDVEQDDVLQESLYFDDSEVYSWYNFVPRNAFLGDASNFTLSYLGALFFEEYAQIWGSKQFNQTHPYLPYEPLNNSQIGQLEKQAAEDLKYIIESNQYLPFTRKGSFTLNGDRRLKIGNLLRFRSTGEIFFIDAVQQDYQVSENGIDRTTTVQVSRGMIEQLIYGVSFADGDGVSKAVSYFNIINTALNYKEQDVITEIKVPRTFPPANIAAQSSLKVSALASPGMVKGAVYLEKYNSYPANKDVFIRFINGITQNGYKVFLTPLSTNRTYIEQAALKAENQLNAAAGSSKHEHFKAIDITLTNTQTGKSYSKNTSQAEWLSTGIPSLAQTLGLQWGGPSNDGTFGSYVDRVHFQLKGDVAGNNINAVPVEYDIKQVKSKGIDRDALFSNFKVDQLNFNFFLKNLQLDPTWRNVTSRKILKIDNGAELLDTVTVKAKRKLKK